MAHILEILGDDIIHEVKSDEVKHVFNEKDWTLTVTEANGDEYVLAPFKDGNNITMAVLSSRCDFDQDAIIDKYIHLHPYLTNESE